MFDVVNPGAVDDLVGEHADEFFDAATDAQIAAAYAEQGPRVEVPIDDLEPGLELAARLSGIVVEALSGEEQLAVLRAQQRMASHYAAASYGSIAAVSDTVDAIEDDPVLAAESTAAEIRVALTLTRRRADDQLHLALRLRRRLPAVWAALSAGRIDVARARVLVDDTEHLSIGLAQQVIADILPDATGLTTGQLRARLRRLCIQVDPAEATDRYRAAISERRVITQPTPEGTAHLFAYDLPPDQVTAVTDRINRLARTLRQAGEQRSMDQLRADVFIDLLLGTRHRTGGGVVDIRVDLATLARLVDHPGDLAGYGPVTADIARQITEHVGNQWRYTVSDPETGTIVDTGVTRRRPTTPDRRAVESRDTHCVFPGCRMPATNCDLDHTTPYGQGGTTTPTNLAPLCRHDHRIKHTGWTYHPQEDGTYHWTSRLGATYQTKPP
ncbi:MAG: DUF222 domain-containing protein [Acidimicrobiia bacterium]|nr:DUF222 domain-containing protein [Acidimicrobiia bacterium]